MKIIAAFLICLSTSAFAQKAVELGNTESLTYRIKKDSFVIYKDYQYIGLSVDVIENKTQETKGTGIYKLSPDNCSSNQAFELLMIDDLDTNVLNKNKTTLEKKSLPSTVSKAICLYFSAIKNNADVNEYSNQNMLKQAKLSEKRDWSDSLALPNYNFSTLSKSIRAEENSVSITGRFQGEDQNVEYFRAYIDKSSCEKRKGNFSLSSLGTQEQEYVGENLVFDLNAYPNNKKDIYFKNLAKEMCSIIVQPIDFKLKDEVLGGLPRKRINLGDYIVKDEPQEDMFTREVKRIEAEKKANK